MLSYSLVRCSLEIELHKMTYTKFYVTQNTKSKIAALCKIERNFVFSRNSRL